MRVHVASFVLLLAATVRAEPTAMDAAQARAESAMEHFHGACESLQPPPPRCDELLFTAAADFRGAGDMAHSIAASRLLIAFDERARLRSPLASKSALLIAQGLQSIGVFDGAAEWFERYSESSSGAREAEQALADATILRLGLGNVIEATANVKRFVRTYAVGKPLLAADLVLALAATQGERESWDDARTTITGATAVLAHGAPDTAVRARAVLALAYANGKKPDRARSAAEYAAVDTAFGSGDDFARALAKAHPEEDEARTNRRLARVLTAVGEARFAAAEARRHIEVDALRGRDPKSIQKKRAAIEQIEQAYHRTFDVKPFPPPKWVIAASGEAGLLWAAFAAELKKGPAYDDAKRRAHDTMREALALSVEYQYRDTRIDACEAWLAKSYDTEFHRIDEIIPRLRGTATLEGPTPTRR